MLEIAGHDDADAPWQDRIYPASVVPKPMRHRRQP
jgi:hypothetical protein